jgi:hypothetical protein
MKYIKDYLFERVATVASTSDEFHRVYTYVKAFDFLHLYWRWQYACLNDCTIPFSRNINAIASMYEHTFVCFTPLVCGKQICKSAEV